MVSVLAQMPLKAIDRKYQSKRQFARQMPAQDADAMTTNASHDGGLLNSP
jgi:pyrroline-5-carboxylate reductase